jgi:Spy/CpxP family protein refolding chaperone
MRFHLALIAGVVLVPALSAQPVAQQPNPNRVALERQFRQRTGEITKQRLGLTDTQMQQLERVNSRFAPQLSALATQERETRRQLRQDMMAGDQANQQRVSALLDASLSLQKRRIALIEAEQKELAAFLTPVQRAQYIALQAQFRNRAEQLARPGAGGPRGGMRRNRPGPERGR